MRVVIATRDFEAVGFNVPVAEFLDRRALQRQPDLRQIGPDLLGASFDAEEAIRRFRARSTLSIADALINQRIVAGAGNVFKSEVLFLCGINPFARVADVSDDELRCAPRHRTEVPPRERAATPTRTIATYTGFRRTTGKMDPAERLYVYGRARRPCRKCGTSIRVKAQGPDARLTYWCPVSVSRRDRDDSACGVRSRQARQPRRRRSTVTIACCPRWLTGPEICLLENGGCTILFRSPRSRLLGVPNAALGLLLYVLLAIGLLRGWPAPLLIVMTAPAVAMSAFLAYSLVTNHHQCRICWTGHAANAALMILLIVRWMALVAGFATGSRRPPKTTKITKPTS